MAIVPVEHDVYTKCDQVWPNDRVLCSVRIKYRYDTGADTAAVLCYSYLYAYTGM